MGTLELSNDLRITFGDVLLVASAFAAVVAAIGLAWTKVIRPVRLAARQAFAHSIAEATRVAVTAEIAPMQLQVADLHTRLSAHLIDEAAEVAGIHEAVDRFGAEVQATFDRRSRAWKDRFETLEHAHATLRDLVNARSDHIDETLAQQDAAQDLTQSKETP